MLFRSIADVAEELALPQHVLRFWETQFSQLRPIRKNRRRYYRAEDVELLHGISALLHDQGLTIIGLKRLWATRGTHFVRAVGRGEHESDVHAAPVMALSDLSSKQHDALTMALADPDACRALAEFCLTQWDQFGGARV